MKYRLLLLFAVFALIPDFVFGKETDNKTVTLVVSGEGETKNEATKNALRSAIEQAFGTFVSANTLVLNDELVKDEIITISSGNIQSYKEIGYTDSGTTKEISLQATVSIGNLVKFAQNKGMTTELSGATYAFNKQLYLLNKKNEEIAIKNLLSQLKTLANNGLFDYRVEVGDPTQATFNEGTIKFCYDVQTMNMIKTKVIAEPNANAKLFRDILYKTILSLAMSSDEIEECKKTGRQISNYYLLRNYKIDEKYRNTNNISHLTFDLQTVSLRQDYGKLDEVVRKIVIESSGNFVLSDNLSNSFQFYCDYDESLLKELSGDNPIMPDSIHFIYASMPPNDGYSGYNFERLKYISGFVYLDNNVFKPATDSYRHAITYMDPTALLFIQKEAISYDISIDGLPPKPKGHQDRQKFTRNLRLILPSISRTEFEFYSLYSDKDISKLTSIEVSPLLDIPKMRSFHPGDRSKLIALSNRSRNLELSDDQVLSDDQEFDNYQNYEKNDFAMIIEQMHSNYSLPFDGCRLVDDYDHCYLVSIVVIGETQNNGEMSMSNVAKATALRKASQFFRGSLTRNSVITTPRVEEYGISAMRNISLETIKMYSEQYVNQMTLLTSFENEYKAKVYVFYKMIN